MYIKILEKELVFIGWRGRIIYCFFLWIHSVMIVCCRGLFCLRAFKIMKDDWFFCVYSIIAKCTNGSQSNQGLECIEHKTWNSNVGCRQAGNEQEHLQDGIGLGNGVL